MAEAVGVSTMGNQYMHGLAEFPSDPGAWVNGTGDVLRIAKERGFNVHGAVEYQSPAPARGPAPDVAIAPDLVDAEVDQYMALDPGELREDVRERGKVRPSKSRNPASG